MFDKQLKWLILAIAFTALEVSSLGTATAQSINTTNSQVTPLTQRLIIGNAASQTANLEGQLWVLSSYQGRDVLPSTEITATFADGRVSGSAGCNRYSASYTISGSQLLISSAGSTRKLCQIPEGRMAQERDYLEALRSTATYQIQGEQLLVFNEAGDRILTFTVRRVVGNR